MLRRFQPQAQQRFGQRKRTTGVNQAAVQRRATQPDRAMPRVQAPRSYMPAQAQKAVQGGGQPMTQMAVPQPAVNFQSATPQNALPQTVSSIPGYSGQGPLPVGWAELSDGVYVQGWNDLTGPQRSALSQLVNPYLNDYHKQRIAAEYGFTPEQVAQYMSAPKNTIPVETGKGVGQRPPHQQTPANPTDPSGTPNPGPGGPGDQGNNPGGGGGDNLPDNIANVIETNPLYIQGLAALDDELNALLTAAGVEEADARAFTALMKGRLGISHQEGLRRTDEATNERGIYNSGIRTRDRGYVDLDFSQRYQDADLGLLNQLREVNAKRAEAQSKKKKGVSDLAFRTAEYLAANGVPGGAGGGNGGGNSGGGGGGNSGGNQGGGAGGGQAPPQDITAPFIPTPIPRPSGDPRNTPGNRPPYDITAPTVARRRYIPTNERIRRRA